MLEAITGYIAEFQYWSSSGLVNFNQRLGMSFEGFEGKILLLKK